MSLDSTKLLPAAFLRLLMMSIALLTFASCEKDPSPPESEHDKLVKTIRQALPQSWALEESAGQILVFRKEPVRSHGCIGLDLGWMRRQELLRKFVEESGVTQDFKIRLLLRPKLDSAEYARIKAVNDQIHVTKSTSIQGREFYEYGAMSSFDPRYRELPQYFTTDSSVYLQTTMHPWACIYPPEVARECEQVLQTLDMFFTRYPDARSRRWSWL